MSENRDRRAGGEESAMRRRVIKTMGAAGAAVLVPRWLRSQTAAEPPSTVSTPAARFRSRRTARHLSRPRPRHRRSGVQRPAHRQHTDPTAMDRRAVVGRPGLVEPGPLSRLERHPERPPAALARGRRPRHRVSRAVEQQQRQHVRLPGAASLVRAPAAPRRALRARRQRRRAGRRLRRQATELAERRRAASRRQLLVHRSAVRRAALRRRARCARRAEQRARRAAPARRPGCRDRRRAARAADERLSRRAERPRHPRDRGRPLARAAERARVLGRLQEAVRRQRRQPARRRRRRRRPRRRASNSSST